MGWVTGVLSVCFGLLLVYQIGFVDGLFGSSPHWAPE
jgi:high-affinity nickel-transport protein